MKIAPDSYENMMDDLQEKAQMIEWMRRNTFAWQSHILTVFTEDSVHQYSEDTFINSMRKAMINHD